VTEQSTDNIVTAAVQLTVQKRPFPSPGQVAETSRDAGGGDERCCGSELRLHVQTAHHRQQQRRQDVVPVPLLGRLLLVVVRQYSRHRLQSQDRVPAGQTHQTTDLGIENVYRSIFFCHSSLIHTLLFTFICFFVGLK